jgi:ketosteroid isomerase-like protein
MQFGGTFPSTVSIKKSAMPQDPVDALRQLITERVAAVEAKDPTPLASRQASDIVTFDVLPPLMSRGTSAVIEKTQQWFDGYATKIGYEVEQLDIRANDQLGFCSFVYHVSGTLQSGDEVDMWVRATLCCEQFDGQWRIVHDHESVPFDPETGQAQISLKPSIADADPSDNVAR